jgi:hypothetical protein
LPFLSKSTFGEVARGRYAKIQVSNIFGISRLFARSAYCSIKKNRNFIWLRKLNQKRLEIMRTRRNRRMERALSSHLVSEVQGAPAQDAHQPVASSEPQSGHTILEGWKVCSIRATLIETMPLLPSDKGDKLVHDAGVRVDSESGLIHIKGTNIRVKAPGLALR